uniref:Transmembrane protein n=1 Tax=Caenorhabditis japonica TaxID=281687 RepID=A0A8R1IQ35_CAEJA
MWHSSSSIRNVFPTTAIFVTLAVLVFIGSLIFSTVAKFNPLSTQKNVHWSEFIYSIDGKCTRLDFELRLPFGPISSVRSVRVVRGSSGSSVRPYRQTRNIALIGCAF